MIALSPHLTDGFSNKDEIEEALGADRGANFNFLACHTTHTATHSAHLPHSATHTASAI